MKTHSFIANGKTSDFYFTGNFFLKSNIVVQVNGQPATNYNLICTSDGRYADIPYTGGCVHFYKPPKVADVITISRELPLVRVVDYQPTSCYDPVALNHDLNYLMEIIKDLRQDLGEMAPGASSGDASQESIDILSRRLDAMLVVLAEMQEQIDSGADMSSVNAVLEKLAASVDELAGTVRANSSSITNLNEFTNGVHDYVIESQTPTAENKYTWYRKYKSGWVEQGGLILQASPTGNITLKLPIEMSNVKYSAFVTLMSDDTNGSPVSAAVSIWNKTTTSFSIRQQATADKNWAVFGMGA